MKKLAHKAKKEIKQIKIAIAARWLPAPEEDDDEMSEGEDSDWRPIN